MSSPQTVSALAMAQWFELGFIRGPAAGPTRFYRLHVEQDLWGEWTLTRVHGRSNSRLGRTTTVWHGPRDQLIKPLLTLIERRHRRHYRLRYSSLDPKEIAMEPVQEVLRLLKRQAEIEAQMRRPGGIRITEERELIAIRERLQHFPAATKASLEAASALHRPVEQISVDDVERFQGIRPHETSQAAA